MLWGSSAVTLLVWFVLKFIFHKGGYIHILLLLGLSILIVQIIAYRNTQYHLRQQRPSS